MKTLLVSAALTLTAVAAQADAILLTQPIAGASLHDGAVDMSVYYTEVSDGLEVVATYAPKSGDEAASRLSMVLADGDAVTFGLPGARGVTYTFARAESDVTVTANRVGTQFAQN